MEYEIDKNLCIRKDELPRLMQNAIMVYSSGGLNRMLMGDFLTRPRPKYLKNHKLTIKQIKEKIEYINREQKSSKRARDELIKLYNEDSEIRSLVALIGICTNCNQNSQCSNYQNYQRE